MRVANLHAHIITPAGVDAGVVDAIQEWKLDDVLDGAGKWSLECWAKKSNVELLVAGRRVDVYGSPAGSEILLSSGYLDARNPDVNKLGGSRYPVSGQTRIGELSGRNINNLDIVELGWTYLNNGKGAVWWLRPGGSNYNAMDLGPAYDANLSTWGATLNPLELIYIDSYLDAYHPETATWLYVGYDAMFNKARLTFADGVYNTNAAILEGQYFDGTIWENLPLSDGTSVGGKTWAQNGVIEWTRPSDWKRYTGIADMGNWYWVRFRPAYDPGRTATTYVKLAEVEAYADVPTHNGLNLIMANAPSGWKTSGYADTPKEAYGTINDMSILTALRWLRDQVGGHFKANLVGGVMQIDWISSFASSGYTADGTAP